MFNGRGQSATVIDAKSGKVVATVPLGGKPEFAAADSKAGRVYDNLEDKSEVVAIDTQTHAVVNRWPIAPGEEASGMAFDAQNHRLFRRTDLEKTGAEKCGDHQHHHDFDNRKAAAQSLGQRFGNSAAAQR